MVDRKKKVELLLNLLLRQDSKVTEYAQKALEKTLSVEEAVPLTQVILNNELDYGNRLIAIEIGYNILVKNIDAEVDNALDKLKLRKYAPFEFEKIKESKLIYDTARKATRNIQKKSYYKIIEEALIKILKEKKLRYDAIIALGMINSGKSVQNLIQSLKPEKSDIPTNEAIIDALCLIEAPKSTGVLIDCLKGRMNKYVSANYCDIYSSSPNTYIIEILGFIGGSKAITQLINIALDNSADFDARHAAIKSLVKTNSTKISACFIKLLEDKNHELSIFAINALGYTNDSKAISPLIKLLDKEGEHIDRDLILLEKVALFTHFSIHRNTQRAFRMG